MAEAYAKSGDRMRAKENYQRSLALDPANTNAVEQLRLLGAEPS